MVRMLPVTCQRQRVTSPTRNVRWARCASQTQTGGNSLTECKNPCCRCSTKNAPQNKNSPRAKIRPVQHTMLMVSALHFMACAFSFETSTHERACHDAGHEHQR